jgi:hypothetical protein
VANDPEKRRLRTEVAELAEAVRELRAQIAQQSAHHHCHGCTCLHWHYSPLPPQPYYPVITTPYVITCGSTTGNINTKSADTVTYTSNNHGAVTTALGAINYS